MILIKNRDKPKILCMLESLNGRIPLQAAKIQYLKHLKKGLDGEKAFDSYTNQLSCGYLIVRDTQIEMDHTYFQIDSLIITRDKLLLYEVKNYECIHSYTDGKLIRLPNFKRDHPFLQQDKCERRLQRLLSYWGTPLSIEKKWFLLTRIFLCIKPL